MRILVVCGAGASSTFVARRLQQAARSSGRDHVAAAATRTSLAARLDDADLVLVGPHLTGQLDQIRAEAAARGVVVLVLPDDVFDDQDGARTLRLVEDAASPAPSEAEEREPEEMR